jgi:hypothetical protein
MKKMRKSEIERLNVRRRRQRRRMQLVHDRRHGNV